MKLLKQHIEALIFTADQPVSQEEITNCLKTVYGWELEKEEFDKVIEELKAKYDQEEFSFGLNEIAGGLQFLSKKEYHTAIHVMLQLKEKKRLSTAALETLAIIAYKQPITKPELENIRGVSCDYSIQKLLEKELIVISGKSDGPGRPILYKTSQNFMDHFGLKSVKDLPKLKDIHPEGNQIGMPSELLDSLGDPLEEEMQSDVQNTDRDDESIEPEIVIEAEYDQEEFVEDSTSNEDSLPQNVTEEVTEEITNTPEG